MKKIEEKIFFNQEIKNKYLNSIKRGNSRDYVFIFKLFYELEKQLGADIAVIDNESVYGYLLEGNYKPNVRYYYTLFSKLRSYRIWYNSSIGRANTTKLSIENLDFSFMIKDVILKDEKDFFHFLNKHYSVKDGESAVIAMVLIYNGLKSTEIINLLDDDIDNNIIKIKDRKINVMPLSVNAIEEYRSVEERDFGQYGICKKMPSEYFLKKYEVTNQKTSPKKHSISGLATNMKRLDVEYQTDVEKQKINQKSVFTSGRLYRAYLNEQSGMSEEESVIKSFDLKIVNSDIYTGDKAFMKLYKQYKEIYWS